MIFRYGWQTLVGAKKLNRNELLAFPPFIRFDKAEVCFNSGSHEMEKKLELLDKRLDMSKQLKSALKDAFVVDFYGRIDQADRRFFNNHSEFLAFLQSYLLPIFASSTAFKFTLCFVSDECGVKCVLSSILQMDPIKDSSSDVKFAFFGANQCGLATDLPIEDISAWLNRRKHNGEIIGREQTLFLEIIVPRIQNAREICDHLKEVSFCNI